MVFQLPSAVDPDTVGVIFYSFVCLISNILLVWLTWTHNDRTSYIACIAYATLIVTMTSIAQQFYDYAYWRDILTDQFYYARENTDNAEVQYHKGSRGVKLILSYIRIFGFTIESTFVFFFALSLAVSVYGWFATTPRTTRTISIIGRILPFILTASTVGLMHSTVAKGSFLVYMLVANTQFVLSLLGSAILLLMILFKYVHSRRNLQTWNVLYGNAASTTTGSAQASKTRSVWLGSSSSRSGGGRSRAYSGGGRSRAYSGAGANNSNSNNTYDSWLVIRLSIAFMVLCVFEYTNVIPRISAANHTVDSADDLAPDLSVKRARASIRGYVSGVTPSLVAFLVFGTTKTFQRKIYYKFVPKCLQRKWPSTNTSQNQNPKSTNMSFSLGNSRPSPHLPPTQRLQQQHQPADEFSLNDMTTTPPPPPPRFANFFNYSAPHSTNDKDDDGTSSSPSFKPHPGGSGAHSNFNYSSHFNYNYSSLSDYPGPLRVQAATTPNVTFNYGPSYSYMGSPSPVPSQATTISHPQPSPTISLHPTPLRPPRPMTGASLVSGAGPAAAAAAVPSLHSKFSSYRPDTRDKALPRPPCDGLEGDGEFLGSTRFRHPEFYEFGVAK